MADSLIARLSTRDRRVWGSVGPWGFRGSVSAPGRSPTRPSVTFGAFIRASRARGLSPTRVLQMFGPGTSRTSLPWPLLGSFLLKQPRPWSSCRLSRATCSLSSAVSGSAASTRVVQRSPLHRSTLLESTPGSAVPSPRGLDASFPSRRGLPPRSRATRLRSDLTVSTVSPACSSCRLPGLHPAPILGFAAFPSVSALASASFPAARFHPSKPCSPPNAATLAHAMVAAARHLLAVADTKFTEPLPSSSFRQSPSRPGGTSRVSSFCGAVPPCAVSSADGPLLPWACQSCD